MGKKYFALFIGVLLTLSFVTKSYSQAKVSGEVLNVNYKYKAAFTDLSGYDLQINDVVEVRADGDFIAYLRVSEVTGAISKLVPIYEGKYTTKANFREVDVGHTVIKVENATSSPVPDPIQQVPEKPIYQDPSYSSSNQGSSYPSVYNPPKGLTQDEEDLQAAYERIGELELKNRSLTMQLQSQREETYHRLSNEHGLKIQQLRETIRGLEKNLKNIERLINRNLSTYDQKQEK